MTSMPPNGAPVAHFTDPQAGKPPSAPPAETKQVIRRAVAELVDDNIRKQQGSEEFLDGLCKSLAIRQDYPILIDGADRIIDGHQRVAAAKRAGITHLDAIVVEGDLTPSQRKLIALRTAVHRLDLSDYDRFCTVKDIALLNPDWSKKRLAEELVMKPPVVTQLLTEGGPEVEAAFRDGKISRGTRYDLALFPPGEQAAALAARLSGVKRDVVTAARKKRKPGDGKPEEKIKRFKLESKGVSAVFAGRRVGISDLVTVLGLWHAAAKAAAANSQSITTLAGIIADADKKDPDKPKP